MKKAIKALLIIVGIALFLLTFFWLASFLFRFFMSGGDAGIIRSLFKGKFALTTQVRSYPLDILHYQMAYGHIYERPLKGAWFLSGAIHLATFLIILKGLSKRPSLYGDSRFAKIREIEEAGLFISPAEVKKGGLFAGTKIIVGRIGNRFLALPGQLFAALMAPTRSGKGVGVVVPVALSYAHSMVVSDIKLELFRLTAAFRAKCGHEVHLFDPFDPEGRTARWNPLSYVSRSDERRVDDLLQIATCLIEETHDSFWSNSARKLFLGLGLYCLDKEQDYRAQNNKDVVFVPTIKEILNLATDFSGGAIQHFSSLMNDEFVSAITRQSINSAISAGEKPFASVLATLTASLSPWLSEPIANATSGDDFDMRDIRRKPMTIYLGITPNNLIQAKTIINLFYSILIHENTSVMPDEDASLQYQCLMLMDEGTAAGRINILEKAISYMAGYNLRLLFIAQSPAQLEDEKTYGTHGARNILTNIALKILFKPNDVRDSEEYSKLLGKITVEEDTSRSRGGGNRGVSTTRTQNQRDLMMPQELRAMPLQEEIIIYDGISHPIKAQKICYYKDRVFIPRFKGQRNAIVRPLKERMVREEVIADAVKAIVRDESRTYRNRLEDNINEYAARQAFTTAVVGNFIGRMLEENTQRQATAA